MFLSVQLGVDLDLREVVGKDFACFDFLSFVKNVSFVFQEFEQVILTKVDSLRTTVYSLATCQ